MTSANLMVQEDAMATHVDKLKDIFVSTLKLDRSFPSQDLIYAKTPGWDSLTHLTLVAQIEEAFGIMMDTEDVLDMSSFEKAVSILGKYGVGD